VIAAITNTALIAVATTMALMLGTAICAALDSHLYGAFLLTTISSGCITAMLFWLADYLLGAE